MTLTELIARRYSCRSYLPQPVEKEKLTAMLEAARMAPSAVNAQGWRYTVVTRPELLARAAECARFWGTNGFVSQAPALIVVQEGSRNLIARASGRFTNQDFASIDIGLSVMQLCLSAAEQGLATCILGAFDEASLRNCLSLDKERIRLVVCAGYAKDAPPAKKTRKPLSEIARFIE